MSDDAPTSTAPHPVADQHAHGDASERPPAGEPIFTRADIAGFDADDANAGRAIGKMLAIFFVYTVIAMSVAAWWTWSSGSQ